MSKIHYTTPSTHSKSPKSHKMTMAQFENSPMDRAADASGAHGKEGSARDMTADKKMLAAINKGKK